MITGESIRTKRKALGMSAEQLADLLHVSKNNLYKWEKGHVPSSPDDYRKLEDWLNGKIEQSPEKSHRKPLEAIPASDLSVAAISDLTASNKMMAAAMLKDAENRERLTRSNEMLTHKVIAIAFDPLESFQALSAAIESLRIFVVGHLPKTQQEEARKILERQASSILHKRSASVKGKVTQIYSSADQGK